MTHRCTGGCHCGKVKFEVEVPASVTVHRCNCSICRKSGYLHLIVPGGRFRLLSGQDELSEYRFHTGVARHLFCSTCGIKPFYVPRSHPDSFSINLNCVDLPETVAVTIEEFDGRNWSESRAALD
ncbi:MAG: GFA family protein [Lysobacterales bacterium]|jgi:hypothetical protein